MRSHWTLQYTGPYTSIVLKKFERFLGVKVLDVEKERYIFDNLKLERRDFFIEHEAQNWEDLVVEILHLAGKLTPEWIMTVCPHQNLSGLSIQSLMRKKGGNHRFSDHQDYILFFGKSYTISNIAEQGCSVMQKMSGDRSVA